MPLNGKLGAAVKALAITLAALVIVFLGSGFYLYRLSQTLPTLDDGFSALEAAQTSFVYASDGSVLAEWHGAENRVVVPFSEMPVSLRNAVVAIEDKRFYEHNGVDLQGIMRALRVNTDAGEVKQGGSTITQQLTKILFTDGQRTYNRKLREILLAWELEVRVEKDEVLEAYLNTVYFGNGSYGVESAAQSYFGKSSSELSLAECALLAGVIQSPSRFDPTRNPELAVERRATVLARMREQGYIDRSAEREAAEEPLELRPPAGSKQVAPYFVEYVRQDLLGRLGEKAVYEGGLRVYTTLDPTLQASAERAARTLSSHDDPEVALVSVRHADGAVLAMVGGRDFSASQFNLAAQGKRQPGSAFKTFVLVTALEKGIKPDKVFDASVYSVPVKDGIWRVQNYENNRTAGSLTLQAATDWSVNTVFARLIMQLTPEAVADTAERLGIETPIDPNPAIALGGLTTGVSPLEMAAAYGTIANGGLKVEVSGIERVVDDQGNTVYAPAGTAVRVMDEGPAVQTAMMLHNVVERGTGAEAQIPVWAAGKTGTTQSHRDAWFVGWGGGLSTAVWVGYPDAQVSMANVRGIKVTGGSFPAQIWGNYMTAATKQRKQAVTPAESGEGSVERVEVRICQSSMRLANRNCEKTVDIYLGRGLAPKLTCTQH